MSGLGRFASAKGHSGGRRPLRGLSGRLRREADISVQVQGREYGGGNQCKLLASFHCGSTHGGKACFLSSSKQGQRSFGGYFQGCFRELSLKVFLCGIWRSVPH